MTQTLAQPGIAAQFPSVRRWRVTALPAGWIYVLEFGIRQMKTDAGMVAASVGVGEDNLDSDSGLAAYIEKQKKLIKGYLKETKFAGPQATVFTGAEEAQLLFVRHNVASAGNMLHAQTYVRLGRWLGIITLTTLEAHLRTVRSDYEVFVKGLQISVLGAKTPTARS